MLDGSMKQILLAAAFCFLSLAARAEAIGYEGARHLLNRTGFGAGDAQIREFAPLARDVAVGRILAGARREATHAAPAFSPTDGAGHGKLRLR